MDPLEGIHADVGLALALEVQNLPTCEPERPHRVAQDAKYTHDPLRWHAARLARHVRKGLR